jgi:hypothetical protein
MPNIISVAELRGVLGVSSSLYSDVYLENIIDSAEGVVLPMLTAYQAAITGVYLENDIAYYTTQRLNGFVVGQSVNISGCVPNLFNGTYTITDNLVGAYTFSVAKINADVLIRPVIPAGVAALDGASAAELYVGVAPVESALLVVSVEIFQSITAPGGQIEGVDFQPSPFRMGRSLQNRVTGLLSPFVDVENICQ